MGNHVAILGAGAIGRWTAYFLSKEGFKVTLIDKGDMQSGCSFGNAGMIVPSHVIPLAAPGMVAKGFRWMLRSKSPFYVRPRLNTELLRWGRSFLNHANEEHVNNSIIPLRDLSVLSSGLYQQLSGEMESCSYRPTGLLMAYQSEKVGHEEIEAAKVAERVGLEVAFLNADQVQNLEPDCRINVAGGVLYKSDGLIDPNQWIKFLDQTLEQLGVEIIANAELTSIEKADGKVTSLQFDERELKVDQIVVAAGAWSAKVARLFGDQLKLLPGKGYSFTPDGLPKLHQPTILCEGKVAVSPFGKRTRFGGTMEITSVNDRKINKSRVQGIIDTIERFYPDVKISFPSEIWSGFRPCSSDGLPFIGKGSKFQNVIYATGHGMMGISMAPGTGKLVTELISEKSTSVDITPFRVER